MAMKDHFKVSDMQSLEETMESRSQSKKVWVNFLPNIDLGHMLTMISFAVAMATTYNIQTTRITILEQNLNSQKEQVAEIKAYVKEINAQILQVQITLAGSKGK